MSLLRRDVVDEPPPPTEVPPPSGPENTELAQPKFHQMLVIVAGVLVLGAGLYFFLHRKAGIGASSVTVQPVPFPKTLRLKGTTAAIRARSILVPEVAGQHVGSLTITRLAASGAQVKSGDLLVEFDRQDQIRDSLDRQAEYLKLADQVTEEKAKEDAARAKDETELRQAENDLKKAELEMQKAEILSRIDAEKAQETLKEAKATLRQLRETFDLKRKAAQAGIRILGIQRDRSRQAMLHAQSNAELMRIHAPFEGVVVLNTIWKEGRMGEVQEGDQVRPGVPFMQIVDPSQMEVRVLANQADLLSLRVGQSAEVRLDAYPEMALPARLEQIGPIGSAGSFSPKVRNFAVVFSLKGHDPRLMPDLSAAVDVAGTDLARADGTP